MIHKVRTLMINIPEGKDWNDLEIFIPGYKQITLQLIVIDGQRYEKLEFIPEEIDLCGSKWRRVGEKDIYSIDEIHEIRKD
jgi:hypothetical protein